MSHHRSNVQLNVTRFAVVLVEAKLVFRDNDVFIWMKSDTTPFCQVANKKSMYQRNSFEFWQGGVFPTRMFFFALTKIALNRICFSLLCFFWRVSFPRQNSYDSWNIKSIYSRLSSIIVTPNDENREQSMKCDTFHAKFG